MLNDNPEKRYTGVLVKYPYTQWHTVIMELSLPRWLRHAFIALSISSSLVTKNQELGVKLLAGSSFYNQTETLQMSVFYIQTVFSFGRIPLCTNLRASPRDEM